MCKTRNFSGTLELQSSSNEKSPTPEFVQREIYNSWLRQSRNTNSQVRPEFVQREIYNSRLRQSRNTNSQVRPSQHEIDEFNSSVPPSWSPSLATATRLRWSTVCWTKLPRRVQTISHLLAGALLLPTASITIYAGTKESILISVFRAQNSSSSLTNTISLFLHWKQNKSTATAHIQYSSNVVMQIFAMFNKRILFHPFFSQFLISRNLHRHEHAPNERVL